MTRFIAFSAVVLAAALARGAIKMEEVNYKAGDTNLRGVLVYDDSNADKRPGVVVFPEWWGLTEYPKSRAAELAKLGYVAFAADLYGDGKSTDDPKEAGKLAGAMYKDKAVLRQRAAAAVDQLRNNKLVDPGKIAAIGFCFGGSTALELARGGADLAGVVVFHGGLTADDPKATRNVKAKILVNTGADDPMIPPDQVHAFIDEMKAAGADYQINIYSGAVHAFTNPKADQFNIPGIKYNQEAAERSWQAMKDFFAEIFH